MKQNLLSSSLSLLTACAVLVSSHAPAATPPSASPEQIGAMFKPYSLDLIGFNEAPNGDWTSRVGAVLGMKYSYVGTVSSANHVNKYKTILSRTPLERPREYRLDARTGWNPASVVMAETRINEVTITFASLHLCRANGDGHLARLMNDVLAKEKNPRLVLVGDFNNEINDPDLVMAAKGGLRTVWPDLKLEVTHRFTWNALDPKQREGVIDHVMYRTSAGVRAVDGGIIELEKPLSDHKPIWAELWFPLKPKIVIQ